MNIIIPIGGVGQRFKDEGFLYPKPLINVLGKPMICRVIENLTLNEDDTLHIVYNNQLEEFNFKSLLNFYFPDKNINFIPLSSVTKGAAETVLKGLNELSIKELDNEFLLLDCDTFYKEDIISNYRQSKNKNCIFYFKDTSPEPLFSYIGLENNTVTCIEEKNKISDYANTGAYGFESGTLLKNYIEKILSLRSELYTSYVYKEMLKDNIKIVGQCIKDFYCVGTPLQLQIFCTRNKTLAEKFRICFDLDNTLVSYPKIKGDYSSVEPLVSNIKLLKFLKDLGHTIIIYTARRMRTHHGNVGKVVADISKVTFETLDKFGIPYDEIYFGKPYANFYIDDLAVNPYINPQQRIGIFDTLTPSRSFNEVQYKGDTVVKTTSNPGELYWYKNIPEVIKPHFPKVNSIKNNVVSMENIEGVSFSYLYTTKTLTLNSFYTLLDSMAQIHTSKTHVEEQGDIYSNYVPKLISRYNNNIELYNKFLGSKLIFDVLKDKLSNYTTAVPGIIHGDPVFTNIIKTKNSIKFVDMRGMLGETPSLKGDIFYDYAKIYQSLIGYDFILNDIEIDNVYTRDFIQCFENQFTPEENKYIKLITASLLFSLLPLHEESSAKFTKYFKLIENLI